MDVLDISHRFDALELERVNLETYYVELQERLRTLRDDPVEARELLRQAVNALNVERQHSSKLFALVSDLMVGWVEARQSIRDQSV